MTAAIYDPCRATKAEVEQRREALLDIIDDGKPMTVRQVFYQATIRGLVEKADATNERRRTVQRITSLLLRQTWSDAHLETLGGLLQQIMNREAARALRRALKPPTNEEMAAAL